MDNLHERVNSVTKDKSHCSICKRVSSKTILYVCNSGHILCEKCQCRDGSEPGGGNIAKQSYKKYKRGKCNSCKNKTKNNNTDLASGDCKQINAEHHREKHRLMYDSNPNMKNSDNEGKRHSELPEVTFHYKNKAYYDSYSTDNSEVLTNLFSYNRTSETIPVPRPIGCPVCSKMIAVNSIMLHFYFDHSKVPRLTIKSGKPQQFLLKAADFGLDTKCLSIFLFEDNKIDASELNKNMKPSYQSLLLMGARCNIPMTKCKDTKNEKAETFENDEMVILWICKLVDHEMIYEITLSNESINNKFSYKGEAIHIKNKQDVQTIYQDAGALILRSKAMNKLLGLDGFINVFVCI